MRVFGGGGVGTRAISCEAQLPPSSCCRPSTVALLPAGAVPPTLRLGRGGQGAWRRAISAELIRPRRLWPARCCHPFFTGRKSVLPSHCRRRAVDEDSDLGYSPIGLGLRPRAAQRLGREGAERGRRRPRRDGWPAGWPAGHGSQSTTGQPAERCTTPLRRLAPLRRAGRG